MRPTGSRSSREAAENGRSWTYAELLDLSERAARALLGRFRPGERVAFWAANVPEWLPAFYGAALAGLTLVTVNPAYKRRELEYVLAKSRAAGVFVAGAYRGFDMEAAVAEARPGLPELREVLPVAANSTAFRGRRVRRRPKCRGWRRATRRSSCSPRAPPGRRRA
jgi:acyl-CoA synthetase (AMP-forming)/AMP-acid ligase II